MAEVPIRRMNSKKNIFKQVLFNIIVRDKYSTCKRNRSIKSGVEGPKINNGRAPEVPAGTCESGPPWPNVPAADRQERSTAPQSLQVSF